MGRPNVTVIHPLKQNFVSAKIGLMQIYLNSSSAYICMPSCASSKFRGYRLVNVTKLPKWSQKSQFCYGIDLLIKSGQIIYIFMVAFLTVRSMTKRQPAIKAKQPFWQVANPQGNPIMIMTPPPPPFFTLSQFFICCLPYD